MRQADIDYIMELIDMRDELITLYAQNKLDELYIGDMTSLYNEIELLLEGELDEDN